MTAEAAGRLRTWRDRRGLDQKDAAEMFGVCRETYMRWEKGRHAPGLDSRDRIEMETGIPIDAWRSKSAPDGPIVDHWIRRECWARGCTRVYAVPYHGAQPAVRMSGSTVYVCVRVESTDGDSLDALWLLWDDDADQWIDDARVPMVLRNEISARLREALDAPRARTGSERDRDTRRAS